MFLRPLPWMKRHNNLCFLNLCHSFYSTFHLWYIGHLSCCVTFWYIVYEWGFRLTIPRICQFNQNLNTYRTAKCNKLSKYIVKFWSRNIMKWQMVMLIIDNYWVCRYSVLFKPSMQKMILIDFLLTVKAATLLFIFGRGSAISSAKHGEVRFYLLFGEE